MAENQSLHCEQSTPNSLVHAMIDSLALHHFKGTKNYSLRNVHVIIFTYQSNY